MSDIKWAVLGTGVIANEMAVALKKIGRNIYAVGNRTYQKQLILQRSTELKRYTMIIMICLPIPMLT